MNVTEASAIAIDLGAGSGRVVTVTCRAGRLDLEEAHRFPTPLFRDTETGYDCWALDLIVAQAVTQNLKVFVAGSAAERLS